MTATRIPRRRDHESTSHDRVRMRSAGFAARREANPADQACAIREMDRKTIKKRNGNHIRKNPFDGPDGGLRACGSLGVRRTPQAHSNQRPAIGRPLQTLMRPSLTQNGGKPPCALKRRPITHRGPGETWHMEINLPTVIVPKQTARRRARKCEGRRLFKKGRLLRVRQRYRACAFKAPSPAVNVPLTGLGRGSDVVGCRFRSPNERSLAPTLSRF